MTSRLLKVFAACSPSVISPASEGELREGSQSFCRVLNRLATLNNESDAFSSTLLLPELRHYPFAQQLQRFHYPCMWNKTPAVEFGQDPIESQLGAQLG
jgi:hypothetical protein